MLLGLRHLAKQLLAFGRAVELDQNLCLKKGVGGERSGLFVLARTIGRRRGVQHHGTLDTLVVLLQIAVRNEEFKKQSKDSHSQIWYSDLRKVGMLTMVSTGLWPLH